MLKNVMTTKNITDTIMDITKSTITMDINNSLYLENNDLYKTSGYESDVNENRSLKKLIVH